MSPNDAVAPQRVPGHETPAGQRWVARLADAQKELERAERNRDKVARQAIDAGLSVRAVAAVLKVNKATVSRKYPQTGAK